MRIFKEYDGWYAVYRNHELGPWDTYEEAAGAVDQWLEDSADD